MDHQRKTEAMAVSDDQIMHKIHTVMKAIIFVNACTNASADFALNTTLQDVIVSWVLVAPELRDAALDDLARAMPTPAQGVCARRLILSLLGAYGLGAGLKLPPATRSA